MIDKAAIRRYIAPLSPIPTGLEARGVLPAPPEAVLFDVYGTLFISQAKDLATLGQSASDSGRLATLLQAHGIYRSPAALTAVLKEAIDGEHAEKRKAGVDHPEVDIELLWRKLLPSCAPESVRQFAAEFDMIQNPVFPMPHLSEVLEHLKTLSVRMGIVSNAQFYTPLLFEFFLNRDLEGLGFDPALLFFSYRAGRAKPSPFLFEKAAEALLEHGIPARAALYVGNDMRNDIAPARQVGFKTALFAGDRRSLRLRQDDPAVAGLEPDLIVTGLAQLLDVFNIRP